MIQEDPGFRYTCKLAELEWEILKILLDNHQFCELPHPATGYYQVVKHIFESITSLYEVHFSPQTYFHSLRICYWGGENPLSLMPCKDIWRVVYSPGRRCIAAANNLAIETRLVFEQLRSNQTPLLEKMAIAFSEMQSLLIKAENNQNWCHNLSVGAILNARNFCKIENKIEESIESAIGSNDCIVELALCRFSLNESKELKRDDFTLL